jgi:ribosomal protein S27E
MYNRASKCRRCPNADLLMLKPVGGQGEVDWEVLDQLRAMGSG